MLAQAGAERLRLDGLDDASVDGLLTASVGEHDPQLDAFVAEITGGNPFFVLQYARQLAGVPDLEHVDPTSLPVPDGIRDVLRQRIQRLPEPVVRTLTSAAVLGRSIDPDLVAELVGAPVDECLDHLDLAMTSGLVEDQDAGYVFVHALARETLYAEISAARRMRLHDRAGRVIEAPRRTRPMPSTPIAHHAHLAAPLGARRTRSARARGWPGPPPWPRHATPTPRRSTCGGRSRPTPRPESPTTIEAQCGAAAALLRLARTVEARAGRGGGPHRAPPRSRGTWSRTRPRSTTVPGCGPGASTACRTTTFIAVLTEATRTSLPTPSGTVAGGPCRWSTSTAGTAPSPTRSGVESVEVARACGDRDLLRRGADGAHPRHLAGRCGHRSAWS